MSTAILDKNRSELQEIVGDVQHHKLSNGADVFALSTPVHGLVKIMFFYNNTRAFAAHPVLAELTFQLLKSGTQRLDTMSLGTAFEETGAMLNSYATMDSGVVEVVVLDEQLPAVLPLIFEMLEEPSFPENEFEQLRAKSLQQFQISRQQTRVMARERFMAELYKDHPYGTMVTDQMIASSKHQDLFSFYQAEIRNVHPVLFLAAYDPVKVMQEMNKHVHPDNVATGNSDGTSESYGSDFLSDFSPNSPLHIPMDSGVQSSIRLGRQLFGRNHPDYIVAKVTMTILGGYFSSRLMANLREDKGYTYGVGAGIYTMARGGYMCVSADVGNEHLKHALAEIHSEMDRLASEKVEEDELLLVKQYLSGSYLRSVDGVFNQLSLLSQLNKHHLGKEWMENYLARLDNITSDDILKFAGQYLDYDSMVLVTCGKNS